MANSLGLSGIYGKRADFLIMDDIYTEPPSEQPSPERRITEREVELALEAAFEAGIEEGWRRARAHKDFEERNAARPRDLTPGQQANIKLINTVASALSANSQAIASIGQLVDNMGRLP